ncbi:IclR family transcriptional regulator [Bordetella tumulicola]|uniref:IclR family transcriptional regulator n=1 Tax=Bordetella tumulicola TaxID=1649133 RepID=UPI0039EEE83B
MSEVKLVARTLDLFECYADKGEPLSLTELSQGLQAPMSSTLALVRTLVGRGYLYQTRKRTYYPTKKLMGICTSIDMQDPVLDILRPYLVRLRDKSRETAVLGTREDLRVLYLDVEPSSHPIRYTAQAGETRGLHSNSLGKALLSALEEKELQDVLGRLKLTALTDKTLSSPSALRADLTLSRQRGWSANISESVPDLAAVAAPFCLAGKWYALSIVGPIVRMQDAWDQHVKVLTGVMKDIAQDQAVENM